MTLHEPHFQSSFNNSISAISSPILFLSRLFFSRTLRTTPISKSLGAVTNTFISMKKNRNVLTLELKENFAPNKHIEIQQKFKSVMKRKQKTRVRLVKPTTLQQTEIITNIEDTKLSYLLGLSGAESSIKPEIIDFEIGVVLKVLEKTI